MYLAIFELFNARADATSFRTEVRYHKVELGYDDNMVGNDFAFIEHMNAIFNQKMELKFPTRSAKIQCHQSYVK